MKYEHRCSYCGRTDHYFARGLCRACYDRMRKNGTLEKSYSRGVGSRPYMWSDKTKRILELHKSGMRQVDIVKEVGLTRQAVSLVIKKYCKPTNADRIRSKTDEELARPEVDHTEGGHDMTNQEAVQIIGLMAVIAEHEGTADPVVIREADELAVLALKKSGDSP